MNLKILLLMIINVSFTNLCYTQTVQEALSFAQELYQKEKFDEAINTYHRIIYFANEKEGLTNSLKSGPPGPDFKTQAFFYLADSYLHLRDYSNALVYFDSVKTITDIHDSINIEASFNMIACRILQNDHHYALLTLLDVKDSLSQYFENKKLFYLAVIHFKISEFGLSEHYFIKLVENRNSAKKDQIDQIFNEIDKINRIKPRLAKFLSRVLPGAGQIYYGDFKNGINSFVLNGSLIAVGVYFANVYSVLDAILFTGNWFLRYYKGGHIKAKKGAENKIQTFKNKKFKELINLVAN